MYDWLKRVMFGPGDTEAPAQLDLPPLDAATMRLEVVMSPIDDRVGLMWLRSSDGQTLAGPFPANGKADSRLATLSGNPDREPQRPYGDVGPGEYQLEAAVAPGSRNYRLKQLGPNGALVFRPVASGDSPAPARRLTVHGGGQVSDAAFGTLRLTNETLAALIAALASSGDQGRDLHLIVTLDAEFDGDTDEVWHVSSDEDGGPDLLPDFGGEAPWYLEAPATQAPAESPETAASTSEAWEPTTAAPAHATPAQEPSAPAADAGGVESGCGTSDSGESSTDSSSSDT